MLAHVLTAYVVFVIPAALGTLAILHRALDFYERIEQRQQRRMFEARRVASRVIRRSHRP